MCLYIAQTVRRAAAQAVDEVFVGRLCGISGGINIERFVPEGGGVGHKLTFGVYIGNICSSSLFQEKPLNGHISPT